MRANARAVVDAFTDRWAEGPVLVMPSIKANFSLALRRILTEEGTGCDCFGPGELEAALRTGVDPERISLNGSTKDAELLERAIVAGVRITLDSSPSSSASARSRARLGAVAQVRLAATPLARGRGADRPARRPALDPARDPALQARHPDRGAARAPRPTVAAPELELRGLMVHIGRQGRDPAIWGALAAGSPR